MSKLYKGYEAGKQIFGVVKKAFKTKKNLKKVDAKKNPGLAKLPTKVRNKMGFMKKGGAVK